ncbi:thioredoxin [bacterium]|nr:thioredoxin [bacterium]
MTEEITLTEQDFDEVINKSDIPVLVDFWAPWCGPCRFIGPVISEIADEQQGKVKVGKLNVDDHPGIAQRFGITGIPTIMLFKNGNAVERMVGALPKNMLEAQIIPHLA